MEHSTMRKRGWSVHSEGKASENDDESLSRDEKRSLLNSFPSEQAGQYDDADEDDFSTGDVGDDDGGVLSLATDDAKPARKRQKTGNPMSDMTTLSRGDDAPSASGPVSKETVEVAKKKLSKWAARLFDPDRPRGLIEPPKTIPLNDEFLTAFGKREREYDESVGRTIEIDPSILEDDQDKKDEEEPLVQGKKKDSSSSIVDCKVKISNLLYTTSQETLHAACEVYGPVGEVNLIMDKENAALNTGRAYVTFESPEDANTCVEKFEKLDGRALRVGLALTDPNRPRRSTSSAPARYWEKNISTKCFRCGGVGHMASSCPNEAKAKPCPLCATPGHEIRACPMNRTCFNCGVPGHVSRDCGQRRGLPKRMACGMCFQSGHHRVSCRRRGYDAETHDAKCLVCLEFGHFMCSEMKWFFGLDGVSCFNCGMPNHHGYDCDRPTLDTCARDERVAAQEIARVGAVNLADELNKQQHRGNSRGRQERGRGDGRDSNRDRGHAKSQPPPRDYNRRGGGGYDDRRGGGGNNPNSRWGNQRGYLPGQQPHDGNARGYSDPRKGGRGYR